VTMYCACFENGLPLPLNRFEPFLGPGIWSPTLRVSAMSLAERAERDDRSIVTFVLSDTLCDQEEEP